VFLSFSPFFVFFLLFFIVMTLRRALKRYAPDWNGFRAWFGKFVKMRLENVEERVFFSSAFRRVLSVFYCYSKDLNGRSLEMM